VKRWGGKTMVIGAPREIDALMRTVPATRDDHQVTCAARWRRSIASSPLPDHHREFSRGFRRTRRTKPGAGAKKITPYWRTLKERRELNTKYPLIAGVKCRRNHRSSPKLNACCVRDHAAALFRQRRSSSWCLVH